MLKKAGYKTRKFALLLVIVFLTIARATPVHPQEAYRIILRVDGLTCPFCIYGLEKKLKRLDGSETVAIDVDQGTVEITMAEGKTIEEQSLRRAVEEAGFTLQKITYASANGP